MRIIEITDVMNTAAGSVVTEAAVGIDFGTTNSLIAISQSQTPRIIADQHGRELVPSIITVLENDFIIGNDALSNDKIYSIKRFLGKSRQELLDSHILSNLLSDLIDHEGHGPPKLKLAGMSLPIVRFAAEIFKYLKAQAELALDCNVTKAVVTVPAYFDDAAKGEVMLAAKIAGLEVIRVINEPTAAAYAYGVNKKPAGYYLVYDFGGGTFDVSVLYMQTGILQVISTAGDNMLGGDDIDLLIAQKWMDQYGLPYTIELIRRARLAKEMLSTVSCASIKYNDINLVLAIKEFEQLILPLIKRTMDIVRDTLYVAKNPKLNGIILVGGSSRTLLITKLLQEFDAAILSNIDPDKVVAYGAALQAENLTSAAQNMLLIDVVPLSLGIELYGGITEKIILRNSPLPISIKREFTTYVDYQNAMQFHILQGEREMAKDCRSLGYFELKDLAIAKAGAITVEVTFSIDVDGILSVSALERTTGRAHILQLQPTYGLSEEQMERVLEDAYMHAQQDHNDRLLHETIVNARSLIYHLQQVISSSNEPVSQAAHEAIAELTNSLSSNDRELIMTNLEIVKVASESFVKTTMGYAINKMLKGKHISDFESN